jgi:hypothetical protein
LENLTGGGGPLREEKRREEDNTEMDHKEIMHEEVDWVYLA